MKYINILIIILSIFIISGCEKEITREGKGNLIIEYTSSSSFGSKEEIDNYNIIRVYDNKKIEYGKINEELTKKDLSKEEYQEIINYAFSKSFTSLKEDVTNFNILDGYCTSTTIYFEDGKSKKISGCNPTNKKYKKLENMLNDITRKE